MKNWHSVYDIVIPPDDENDNVEDIDACPSLRGDCRCRGSQGIMRRMREMLSLQEGRQEALAIVRVAISNLVHTGAC